MCLFLLLAKIAKMYSEFFLLTKICYICVPKHITVAFDRIMEYHSTSQRFNKASLAQAIMRSEAVDGGLYMPDSLPRLPKALFNNIAEMSSTEISYSVANSLFGGDLSSEVIKKIGDQTFNFPIPLVEIEPGIYALELFHGPTMNAKDIGARFCARLLAALNPHPGKPLNVLVSTNGNSGSAVANGFHWVDGVNVFAMYPKGTPAHLVAQIASLGANVHAISVNGTIDDCRRMLTSALADPKLNEEMMFTCANSVNIGRVLPHSIVYFIAYSQLMALTEKPGPICVSVPCGNSGGLLAGCFAMKMGLPIDKLVGACNANASFARYFERGNIDDSPAHSVKTLAYAMDTCRPTNACRFHDLCDGDVTRLKPWLSTAICSDADIAETMSDVYRRTGYVLDPHSAVAYSSLKKEMPAGATGIFLATAHPARSARTVEEITGVKVKVPSNLERFSKQSVSEVTMPPTYPALKKYINRILNS